MAREEFGKTWWGEQWLLALSKIDDANRIPRGKTYARNGSVMSLEIKDGLVNATVEGNRSTPFKVTISLTPFTQEQAELLTDKIMEYPTIISKLQNGKMDALLIDVSETLGIKLFPNGDYDLKMKCSCRDLAMPCKHIAAVLYKVTSDIDNNPFLLFGFRQLDLIGLLKSKNKGFHAIEVPKIETYDDFLSNHIVDNVGFEIIKIDINYYNLNNRHNELVQLLENEPPFYTMGNFKVVYGSTLQKIGRVATSLIMDVDAVVKDNAAEEESNYETIPVIKWTNFKMQSSGMSIAKIWKLTEDEVSMYHPAVHYFHELIHLALQCISKGLVVPKIIVSENKYLVLWQPAIIDKFLSKTIEDIKSPFGIEIDDNGKADTFLTLSLFITHFIHLIYKEDTKPQEFVDAIFFTDYKYKFDGPSETSIPISILNWTKLFDFNIGEFNPLIVVNEKPGDKFSLDIFITSKASRNTDPISFKDFIEKTDDAQALISFYKDLDLLGQYIVGLSDYINEKGEIPMEYDSKTFAKFLFEISPVMALLGINVLMPKSLKKLIKPKSSISVTSNQTNIASGLLGISQVLDFDWKVSIGDEIVSINEFNNLVTQADTLIKYKGHYIYISGTEMAALQKQLTKKDAMTNMDLLQAALSEEYEGEKIEISNDVKQMIDELSDVELIETPSSIQAVMRPYQERGFSWLVKNAKIGFGSIIADDMGLGKTLQVLAFLTYIKENNMTNGKKMMVVVPTSLIPNWEAEILKFAPALNFFIFYGVNRDEVKMQNYDLIITSYGLLRSEEELFSKYEWSAVVIDEAQTIKNPGAQQTKAVKALRADNYIAMSGTPVENRLMDYWSVMDFANNGLLGTKFGFSRDFDRPITMEKDQAVLAKFKKITSPFLIRRMKTDKSIISDLPDKIVQDVYANLTKEQAALYEKVVQEGMDALDNNNNEATSLFKRQGMILQMILSLKQICNHPSHWLKDDNIDIALSGKSTLLIDLLSSIIDSGEKAIIFTQFKEMGDILVDQIQESMGIKPLWLHGGSTLDARKNMVNDFQNLPYKKIMILSLKAGGMGLNLTAASHVIHYDLWWNPAVENQATDRAFRIGQTKNVMVHRLVTQHTFEEKINELIKSKMDLANLAVSAGERWIGELSNQEIGELFGR